MKNTKQIELPKLEIADREGGNQRWLKNPTMYIGGCAATLASDHAIYFAKYFGLSKLYPYGLDNITKTDFIKFAKLVKPYIRPRIRGVDRLEIFIEGFSQFLKDKGINELSLKPFSSDINYPQFAKKIIKQIKNNYPVPFLLLHHQNKDLDDYTWHWFGINGIKTFDTSDALEQLSEKTLKQLQVKIVSYGKAKWHFLYDFWNSGFSQNGGIIIYKFNTSK